MVWAYLFGVALLAAWTFALVRDLPRRMALGLAAGVGGFYLVTIAIVGAIDSNAGAGLSVFLGIALGSFLIVTRGHPLRAVDQSKLPVTVPTDVSERYMQAVTRHQVAGLALMGLVILCLFLVTK